MKKLKIRNDRLISIAGKLKKGRILVIGDVMIDQFIYGTVERISPEAPVPVVEVQSETFLLGGAANVINNITAFGGKSNLCGVIGDDTYGRRVKSLFKTIGADSGGLVTDKKRPTTKKTRIIAHSQQVVRFDKEVKDEIGKQTFLKILNYIAANITKYDAVIISDYGKGVITKELVAAVVEICVKNNRIITVDPKTNHFLYYKRITAMTPNHHEASLASGIKITDDKTLERAGRHLMDFLESDCVLITRGEKGMALFEKDGSISRIPTVARNVYDVTGAGDTVIAVFTLALSVGASFREAAVLANYAAGVVVGKIGTATATEKELCDAVTADN